MIKCHRFVSSYTLFDKKMVKLCLRVWNWIALMRSKFLSQENDTIFLLFFLEPKSRNLQNQQLNHLISVATGLVSALEYMQMLFHVTQVWLDPWLKVYDRVSENGSSHGSGHPFLWKEVVREVVSPHLRPHQPFHSHPKECLRSWL